MANTRRLVLEPFIIATAAAVGLNFGEAMRLTAVAAKRLSAVAAKRHFTRNFVDVYSRRSQAVGRCNVHFPNRKEINALV